MRLQFKILFFVVIQVVVIFAALFQIAPPGVLLPPLSV